MLRIDGTGRTPADISLYPALCVVAAERMPHLLQLLRQLSGPHAGERVLHFQQARNYVIVIVIVITIVIEIEIVVVI